MTTKLYETDFSQWVVAQADHLRNEEYGELDLNNLIEEIEDMAARHREELRSRFMQIMAHLLKLEYEPDPRPHRGWRSEIQVYRFDLNHMLRRNPSLRAKAQDYVEDAYEAAKLVAAESIACSIDDFPVNCPWTAEQLLDVTFLPQQ